jgi:hypothetical protein
MCPCCPADPPLQVPPLRPPQRLRPPPPPPSPHRSCPRARRPSAPRRCLQSCCRRARRSCPTLRCAPWALSGRSTAAARRARLRAAARPQSRPCCAAATRRLPCLMTTSCGWVTCCCRGAAAALQCCVPRSRKGNSRVRGLIRARVRGLSLSAPGCRRGRALLRWAGVEGRGAAFFAIALPHTVSYNPTRGACPPRLPRSSAPTTSAHSSMPSHASARRWVPPPPPYSILPPSVKPALRAGPQPLPGAAARPPRPASRRGNLTPPRPSLRHRVTPTG